KKDPSRLIIALTGSGHLIHHHGIPHQLEAHHIQKSYTILPWNISDDSRVDPAIADVVIGVRHQKKQTQHK
ncbi:hypothetical protein ACQZV8_21775, partial [Magnetococcales bacterium HHB-1]